MRSYSQLTHIAYLMAPTQIILCHLGSLLVLFTGLSWGAALWLVSLYVIRAFATTIVYHRLLTHKAFQAPAVVVWVGSFVAAAAGQLGPSCWKAHHLIHHQHTDKAPDPHSPYTPHQGGKGFYHAQGGWLLTHRFFPEQLPKDVERDVVLRVIDRLHFVPLLALGALSYWIGRLEYFGAFCLSTTLFFHGVQTVNSLAHLVGEQPFTTDDHSRNNAFVAFLTMGEGWHNVHHAFQASCRHGFTIRDGQIALLPDPTFTLIKIMASLGLASKLRVPSEATLLARATDQRVRGAETSTTAQPSLRS